MKIEEFERLLVRALLAGEHPLLEALRAQYEVAKVSSRDLEADGFATRLDVPEDAEAIDRDLLHLDDLQLQLAGAETPAEASLMIEDGVLALLECRVYDGAFPDDPEITAAWYYGTERYPGITPELLQVREIEELLEEE